MTKRMIGSMCIHVTKYHLINIKIIMIMIKEGISSYLRNYYLGIELRLTVTNKLCLATQPQQLINLKSVVFFYSRFSPTTEEREISLHEFVFQR